MTTPRLRVVRGPSLDDPVTTLAGVSDVYEERLERIGVRTLRDLLLFFPRRYEDFSSITPIAFLRPGVKTTVRGRIYDIGARQTKYKRGLTEALLGDDSGTTLRVVWFNQPWIAKSLQKGDEIFVAGEADLNGGLVMKNPDHEKVSLRPQHAARLVPIYRETEGLTSKWLRSKIQSLLRYADEIEEFLPGELLQRRGFLSRAEAVRQAHFPGSAQALERARERLAFEEMFVLQLAAQLAKRARKALTAQPVPFDEPTARGFVKALPFQLTNAQRVAAWQILQDIARPQPMNRLLEGDVGSGKTVVAAMTMHHVARAGFQSVLLAPTEVLARQHADVIQSLLGPFQIDVGLLVGSTPATARKPMLASLADGDLPVLIGTHALIEEGVQFKDLALTVVDEQHRFGVGQRLAVRQKSERTPHFLSMTATPIPRTLGLTLFGDLDISILGEMPPGRQPVKTRMVPPEKRADAYNFIRKQVNAGRQVFVICPLIQESDKLGVRSATQELEKLQRDVFPELAPRIALLHGRLKSAEKEAVMAGFQRGDVAILVSTSVVEVGIDIPNATVMMIEGADRFGLAQLHQFRGRVGRGTEESWCFLFTDAEDPQSLKRLQAVVTNQSGFDLAEIDLELRGWGDLAGYRQHGKDFKMASLLDAVLISDAQSEAVRLLDRDPALDGEPALRRQLSAYRQVFALD
ncbi:MAG: ATP-dependent DNA helicase RecG [Chloroflexi bacterium]|nr:MAG: ATP-dependent DNA helicase RecG [Chloroflexota bacterium]